MRNWSKYDNTQIDLNTRSNIGYGGRQAYDEAKLWGKSDSFYTPTKHVK